jgi:hypothetical protein
MLPEGHYMEQVSGMGDTWGHPQQRQQQQQQQQEQGRQKEPELPPPAGATGDSLPRSLTNHQHLWAHQHSIPSLQQQLMPQPVHTAGDSLPRLQQQPPVHPPLPKPVAPRQEPRQHPLQGLQHQHQHQQQQQQQAASSMLSRQRHSSPQQAFSTLLPGETAAAAAWSDALAGQPCCWGWPYAINCCWHEGMMLIKCGALSVRLDDAAQPNGTVAIILRVLQGLTCSSICAAGKELAPPGAGGLQGLSLFNDDVLRLLAEDTSGPVNGQSQVHASLPLLGTGLPLPSRAHGNGASQLTQQQQQQVLPPQQVQGRQQQARTSREQLPREGSDGDLLLLLAQWQQQSRKPSLELPSSTPVCEQQQQLPSQQHQQLVEAVAAASGRQPAMQLPQHPQPQQQPQLLHVLLDEPVRQASATRTATTITAPPATSPADARAASSGGNARSASRLGSAGGETGALVAQAITAINRLSESHFGCTPEQLPQSLRVTLLEQLLYGS